METKFGSLLFYLTLLSTWTIITCRKIRPMKNLNPTLEIINWLEGDNYDWKNGNELVGVDYNETVYFIPNDVVALVIHCSADYPIQFDFQSLHPETKYEESRLWSYSSNLRSYRSVSNMDDTSSFKYGLIYLIYGRSSYVTGNYICQGVPNFSNRQANMRIFWEGTAPPYLLNAGSTQTVTTYNTNGKLVLPCLLSVPQDEIDLNLLREMNVTKENNATALEFQYLDTDLKNVSYDSFLGYIINFGVNDSVVGRYQCVTQEMDDSILVEVISDVIQQHIPKHFTSGKAVLKYDEKLSILTCCSNNGQPPRIAAASCSDKSSCDLVLPFLEDATFETISTWRGISNGSCTNYQTYTQAAMQVRCIGDGIDMIQRIIFPVERKYPNGSQLREVYSKWEEIVPENLIQIYAENPARYDFFDWYNMFFPWLQDSEFTGTLYAGQNVTLHCKTSPYYFAEGSRLKVRSNNSTEVALPVKPFELESYVKAWSFYQTFYHLSGSVILDTSMDSVVCYAPVSNSDRWVRKSFPIKVIAPIIPSLHGDSETDLYWTLNGTDTQELECKISGGDPYPVLKLMKEGKEIVNDTNIKITKTNVSISWTFAHLAYNVHGDYECVATNIAGTYKKTFHIYMEEPHPWAETIIIICVSLALVAGIGILVWRIMRQRNIVTDLRRRVSIVGTNRDD